MPIQHTADGSTPKMSFPWRDLGSNLINGCLGQPVLLVGLSFLGCTQKQLAVALKALSQLGGRMIESPRSVELGMIMQMSPPPSDFAKFQIFKHQIV